MDETLSFLRSKYYGEIANQTKTAWESGNTSVLYVDEIESFSDDQLLRILQELAAEFDQLQESSKHVQSLIIPAFCFTLLGIVFVFCLCHKDKTLERKLKSYEEKLSNENLKKFKEELVFLCRKEYLNLKPNREDNSELKAAQPSVFCSTRVLEEEKEKEEEEEEETNEVALKASMLKPSLIYIPTLPAIRNNNRVFDITQEARPVTAGDIELAWKHKFENK